MMTTKTEYSDFVIIGGVAAGTKTASVLARRLPEAKITLFEKTSTISFATCGLPYFASGDIGSLDELKATSYGVEKTPEFFREVKGVEIHTCAEVIKIDRNRKSVLIRKNGENDLSSHAYGKLVLTTGALPIIPPFPLPNVETISAFTTPEDAVKFRSLAESGKIEKAAIVGGGLIGCELAEAVGGLWGIATTLIEKADHLLPGVLDVEMATIVERELRRKKISVITAAEVTEIKAIDGKPAVSVSGIEDIVVDYLFLALGVRPNSKLAAECGLAIGEAGGIIVDKHMRTSDPDIYAGGDCIESVDKLTGRKIFLPLGSLANRHGRIIAENLSGNIQENPPVLGNIIVKVFDLNVGSVGLTSQKAETAGLKSESVWGSFVDRPDYYPEKKSFTLKLIYSTENGRLLGIQAVGEGDICRRLDVFSALMQHDSTLDDLLKFEHAYAPPYSEALDPLVQMASMAKSRRRGIAFCNPANFFDASAKSVWLDVREPEECAGQPLPSTNESSIIRVPIGQLRKTTLDLDRSTPITLICKRGPRAYQAVHILRQKGFNNVKIVGGGVQALLD